MKKKKKSRGAGVLTAALGGLCALILCVVFYGTMVYQLAGEPKAAVQKTQRTEGYPAQTLRIEGGVLMDEKKETVRMGGLNCDVVTRFYAFEDGTQAEAVSAAPAAYLERLSAENWQAQLVTGFVLDEEDALYLRSGEKGMLAVRNGDAVYLLITAAEEQRLYELGTRAKIE